MLTIVSRPGVYTKWAWGYHHGWLWARISRDQRTALVERVRDGEILWSFTHPDLKLGYISLAAAPDGSTLAVAQASIEPKENPRNDKLVFINGAGFLETEVPCIGVEPCAIRWNGGTFVTFSRISITHYARLPHGGPRKDIEVPAGAIGGQGFLDAIAGTSDDGLSDRLSWFDIDLRQADLPLLLRAVRRGPVAFGQENGPADRLVGVNGSTPFLVQEGLGLLTDLASAPNGEYAATWANPTNHPETATVSGCLLPPFPPWSPAEPKPRPAIRRVKPLRRLHLFAEPDKPIGTGTWSYTPVSALPVLEGIGPPGKNSRAWIDAIPVDHPIWALWWTRDENLTDWDRAMCETVAVERNATIGVYDDGATFEGLADVQALRERKRKVRIEQQCYSGDDHRVAVTAIRASLSAIRTFNQENPAISVEADLIIRCDETTSWPADEIDAMCAAAIDLANEFPEFVSGLGVLNRGTVAGNRWPENRLAWWNQLRADNAAALVFVPVAPVDTETPETGDTDETPDRPDTHQPHSKTNQSSTTDSDAAKNAAIGAAVGGAILFAQSAAGRKTGRGLKKFFGWLKWW